MEIRRAEVAKKRPTWMLAVTGIAIVGVIIFSYVGYKAYQSSQEDRQKAEQAQRAGVLVYSGTYSVQASAFTARPEDNPSMPAPAGATLDIGATMVEFGRLGKKNTADAFARATGGGRLAFTTLDGLEKAIARAGDEIHSQYLLSFVPQTSNKTGFQQIQVAVPKQPYSLIRVRPGYWVEK